MERTSNYDITRRAAEQRFLRYDQQAMVEKFKLKCDEAYLYIRFIGREYRINRNTGETEWSEDQFVTAAGAGYEESLSIFDVLCDSREGCRLSGRFNQIDRMKGTNFAAAPSVGLYSAYGEYFDRNPKLLAQACEALGGKKEKPGDVAYRLDIFEFLPVIFQFWASDEEFPATLKFMWDENSLDYLHFETAFYVMGHLLSRLKEEMERLNR